MFQAIEADCMHIAKASLSAFLSALVLAFSGHRNIPFQCVPRFMLLGEKKSKAEVPQRERDREMLVPMSPYNTHTESCLAQEASLTPWGSGGVNSYLFLIILLVKGK